METKNLMRLNRAMASRGIASRRKSDELIFAGKVKVNGKVELNPATKVAEQDAIEVGDMDFAPQKEKVYLMLNKPPQCVCTLYDPEGRETIVKYFPEKYSHLRLFPVGRLDYFSEGLLILTNDGDFAQRLAHPRHHQKKVYEVLVRESVSPAALDIMRKGMKLTDGPTLLPVEVSATQRPRGTLLTMTLRQGVNRQIRKMCAQLGLTILYLRRTGQGSLKLDVEPGKTRLLTSRELAGMLDKL